jgi:hypothetical protein
MHKKNNRAQPKLKSTPVKKEKILGKPSAKSKTPVLKRSPKPVSTDVVAIRSEVLDQPTKTIGA